MRTGLPRTNPELGVEQLETGGSFVDSKTDDPYISFANFALAIGGMLKTYTKGNIITQLKYTPEQIEKRKARKRSRYLWEPLWVCWYWRP